MKKGLLCILMVCQMALFGQYQIRNGSFESWDNVGSTSEEPTHWSSHMTNTGTYGSLARGQQIKRSSDTYSGTGYSCQIWARSALFGIIANGTATTGRINVGSSSASSTSNHTFTVTNNADFNEPFTGKPDSIRFWAKFVCNSATQYARLHAVIHSNFNYTDPQTGNSANYVVGKALAEFQRGDQEWHQYTVPFDYDSYAALGQTPQYILLTFTTNKNAGSGATSDNLYVDDIEMVYNSRLSNLMVNEITVTDFNPEITDYYINTLYCAENNPPGVTATKSSPVANIPVITQATYENPTATISVTNGNATQVYSIHFSNLVSVASPTVSGDNRCAEGEVSLNAIPGADTNICRWYDAATEGTLLYAGSTYNSSISETSTYYVESYDAISGCESARIPVIATIFPTYQHSDSVRVYSNQFPYTYGDTTFLTGTISGIYPITFTTVNGCDSVINLTLTADPNAFTTLIAEICKGESYTENGFDADTTGIYIQIIPTINGYDSIVNLILTVHPTAETNFIVAICEGETHSENGFEASTTGVYTQNLQTVNGCDSTVTLTLTVIQPIITNLNVGICQGEIYDENGFIADSTGIYIQNLLNVNGCDSTVTLTLTVYQPAETTNITDTICQGEIYTENGFNVSIEGLHTLNLQTVNGCDSTVNLTLTVKPTPETNFTAVICQGESYTENGFDVSTEGVHTRTLQAVNGCDSIVTLNLTVYPDAETNFTAVICQGETYNLNGFNADTTGVYTQNLLTVNGCDSTVTLTLTVIQPIVTNLNVGICQGEVYTENGFITDTTGIYIQNLLNVNGCDSTVTLNLTVYPVVATNFTAEICQGETYNLNGFNANTTGVYTQDLLTLNGCDSTVTLNLTVNPLAETNFTAEICQGETYNLNGFNANTTGIYTQDLLTLNGCDSTVTLNLTVNPLVGTISPISGTQIITEADDYTYYVNAVENATAYYWSIDNTNWTLSDDSSNTTTLTVPVAGTGVLSVYASNGCGTSDTQTLLIESTISIINFENNAFISIYPNPTIGNIEIRIENSDITDCEAEIIDITGKIIKRAKLTEEITQISLSEFANGTYFVKIKRQNSLLSTSKIIKN